MISDCHITAVDIHRNKEINHNDRSLTVIKRVLKKSDLSAKRAK